MIHLLHSGSTLTIFGNPQMALMASKSNAFVDPNSRLELKTCVEYLWLPTFVVWFLNILFLLLHYHLSKRRSNQPPPADVSSDVGVVEQSQEQEEPSIFVTPSSGKLPRFTERFRLRRLKESGEEAASRRSPSMIDRGVSVASFLSLDQEVDENENPFQSSESRFFKIILFTLLVTVIALLFASSDKIYFDIGMFIKKSSFFALSSVSIKLNLYKITFNLGLVPVGAAIILLVADTLINHRPPIGILTRIDWNVLLLFFGLFVWLNGLNSTGIPNRIWWVFISNNN